MKLANLIFIGVSSLSLIFLILYSLFILFREAYRNSDTLRIFLSILVGAILYVLLAGLQIINPEVFFHIFGLPKGFHWWMFFCFIGIGFGFSFVNFFLLKTSNSTLRRLLAMITIFVFLFLGHALILSDKMFTLIKQGFPQYEEPLNLTQLPFIALILGMLFYVIFFKKETVKVT